MRRLEDILRRIDRKGYKAYKETEGSYRGAWFELHIDHAQADPFAPPSRVRVTVPASVVRLRREWTQPKHRLVALTDFLARQVAAAVRDRQRQNRGHAGTGNSGLIFIDEPGQQVLPRTAVAVRDQGVEVRLSVGLPAAGRTVLGGEARRLLTEDVPAVVRRGVLEFSPDRLEEHLRLADRQAAIRQYMEEHGWIAFVANGAVLPRESGASDRPMRGPGVVPFQSPPSLEVEIPVPHGPPVRGMAIPRGVTLIVGGGYHGKTTLLKALERGVYNHIAGDGREYVLTRETACKIRAEDGRSVAGVDISPFISRLPFGKETTAFSTDDASGSTSQAANIMEMLEVGADVLFIDEDTSATNFMIRDARMRRLVVKDQEPITPFIDRVRRLYEERGVSTVLVLGGSGDYFDVADTVILMHEYRPYDVTQEARAIAAELPAARPPERDEPFGRTAERIPLPGSFGASRGNKDKVEAKGLHTILYGAQTIDLSAVEQLVDPSQTRAIARMLRLLEQSTDGRRTVAELIAAIGERLRREGLDMLSPYPGRHPGDLAMPRPFELAAALNRIRSLRVRTVGGQGG